jgi:tRNA (mo5U34)-methyltransferase
VTVPPSPSVEEARSFIDEAGFVWHQRFQLVPEVYTPGQNDLDWIFRVAAVPDDLSGKTALDIGTSNGGAAFELERRGAERVVAVDIYPESWFGFDAVKKLLASRVEYVQASIYELPLLLREEFDVVLFWGVLYHLRHPLLALDSIRALLRGTAYLETAVCDWETAAHGSDPVVRFYRRDELGGDASNWFAPSVKALEDWCVSSGLKPVTVKAWPEGAAERSMLTLVRTEGDPEFETLSYERPLSLAPSLMRRVAYRIRRLLSRPAAELTRDTPSS